MLKTIDDMTERHVFQVLAKKLDILFLLDLYKGRYI